MPRIDKCMETDSRLVVGGNRGWEQGLIVNGHERFYWSDKDF